MKLDRHRVALATLVALASLSLARAQETRVGQHDAESWDYSPFPAPDNGYVTDLDDLLSDDEEERIEVWLWQAESRTGIEIAVVTVPSFRHYPGTPSRSIETFARGLFDSWGIGNMPANDGVLLLVALTDRKVRIELGAGYANTRDADAARIIQEVILPHFRDDDYSKGITAGVQAIGAELASLRFGFPRRLVWIAGASLAGILIALSLFRNGKRGWGWVVVGLVVVLLFFLFRMLQWIVRNMPESGSSSWSAGGVGGSFGGGSSGGGGVTGSW